MAVRGFTYYGDEVSDLWDALYIDEVWIIKGNADEINALAEKYLNEYGECLFGKLRLSHLHKYEDNWIYFDGYSNEWHLLPLGVASAIRRQGMDAIAQIYKR